MTSPPAPVDVDCPECGLAYRAWLRPSVNLDLERTAFEGDGRSTAQIEQALYALVEEMTTGTCPACGYVARGETLVVDWEEPG
jgi:predicted RNA-binding Zn-ribbon protein involved in translation (DUF1610 family)